MTNVHRDILQSNGDPFYRTYKLPKIYATRYFGYLTEIKIGYDLWKRTMTSESENAYTDKLETLDYLTTRLMD